MHTDARVGDFRWLTVTPPRQPDHEVILLEPGPPMMDEGSAQQVRALVAKGVVGAAAFETSDCRGTYAQLSERGVSFLSETTTRDWGTEATLRDNSGNWFQRHGAMTTPTVYGRAGGAPAFKRWLDAFYDQVEQDELLAPLFPGGVSREHREHAADRWCEVMGGPAVYTEQHGATRTCSRDTAAWTSPPKGACAS